MVLIGVGMLELIQLGASMGSSTSPPGSGALTLPPGAPERRRLDVPGLFAVGASLPLLVVTGAMAAAFGALEAVTGRLRRIDRPLRIGAGVVLILAGVHDTLVYWLL